MVVFTDSFLKFVFSSSLCNLHSLQLLWLFHSNYFVLLIFHLHIQILLVTLFQCQVLSSILCAQFSIVIILFIIIVYHNKQHRNQCGVVLLLLQLCMMMFCPPFVCNVSYRYSLAYISLLQVLYPCNNHHTLCSVVTYLLQIICWWWLTSQNADKLYTDFVGSQKKIKRKRTKQQDQIPGQCFYVYEKVITRKLWRDLTMAVTLSDHSIRYTATKLHVQFCCYQLLPHSSSLMLLR